jgi:hypothetical protein
LFDGNCRDSSVPCDLFLLSWTLTPGSGMEGTNPASRLSRAANKELVGSVTMETAPRRTAQGRAINVNLLYTDVVEKSRSVDVALVRNGLDA